MTRHEGCAIVVAAILFSAFLWTLPVPRAAHAEVERPIACLKGESLSGCYVRLYNLATPPTSVEPIRLRDMAQWVCVAYVADGKRAWSCKTAGDVGAWILENGGEPR